MRRLVALVGVLGVAVLASAGMASAHVYWASDGTSTIGRANFDGSSADGSVVDPAEEGQGVAVNATHIYYTDRFGAQVGVGRADLDGNNANAALIPLSVANTPRQLAVDGGHVYWTMSSGIGRADLDGTNASIPFITTTSPIGIAVDAAHIYWTTSAGNIGRADLDGTNVNGSFIAAGGVTEGVAVYGSRIYWSLSGNPGAIGRAKTDGSDVNASWIGGTGVGTIGIAVNAGHVYWSRRDGHLGRALRNGTGADPDFMTGLNILAQLTLDGGGPPDDYQLPSFKSAPEQGVKVAAYRGSWTGLPTGYKNQWVRCDADGTSNCTDITAYGAAATYTPVDLDVGHTLRVRVIATSADGDSQPALSAPSGVVTGNVPAVTQAPEIKTASPVVGVKVSAYRGKWTNQPATFTFRWYRCDADGVSNCTLAKGPGASGSYTPVLADLGRALVVTVVATNATGDSAVARSAPTGLVT
jgi:virginiamycin B lyase